MDSFLYNIWWNLHELLKQSTKSADNEFRFELLDI